MPQQIFPFLDNFSFPWQNRDLKIFFRHVFSIDHYKVFKSMYLAFLKKIQNLPKKWKLSVASCTPNENCIVYFLLFSCQHLCTVHFRIGHDFAQRFRFRFASNPITLFQPVRITCLIHEYFCGRFVLYIWLIQQWNTCEWIKYKEYNVKYWENKC